MQKVVRELSEALGWAETIHIVRKWGGRELRVPKTMAHGDPLPLSLGYATAKRLVDRFAGEKLQLPSERNALLELRNAAIVAEAAKGRSHEAIGLEYGLTRQGVGLVLKKAGEGAPQTVAVKGTTTTTAQSPANA
jgi:hypothetical protein